MNLTVFFLLIYFKSILLKNSWSSFVLIPMKYNRCTYGIKKFEIEYNFQKNQTCHSKANSQKEFKKSLIFLKN